MRLKAYPVDHFRPPLEQYKGTLTEGIARARGLMAACQDYGEIEVREDGGVLAYLLYDGGNKEWYHPDYQALHEATP